MVTESRDPPVNREPREDDSRGSSVFGKELLPGSVDELNRPRWRLRQKVEASKRRRAWRDMFRKRLLEVDSHHFTSEIAAEAATAPPASQTNQGHRMYVSSR